MCFKNGKNKVSTGIERAGKPRIKAVCILNQTTILFLELKRAKNPLSNYSKKLPPSLSLVVCDEMSEYFSHILFVVSISLHFTHLRPAQAPAATTRQGHNESQGGME